MHNENGSVRGAVGAGFYKAVLICCFVTKAKEVREYKTGFCGFIRLFVICYVVSEVILLSVEFKSLLR
jgi:hypothetical protein